MCVCDVYVGVYVCGMYVFMNVIYMCVVHVCVLYLWVSVCMCSIYRYVTHAMYLCVMH